MKSCCYHIRNDAGQKIRSGFFHCSSYEEAAEYATAGLRIERRNGSVRLIDPRTDKPVDVYLSVLPDNLPEGARLQAEMDAEREFENSFLWKRRPFL